MQIDGIHHISTMTADGRAATDYVTGVLGLRLAAKTVNQDAPDMYHLFFTDEDASAGSDLTMFETRGMPRGRDGAGMVHRIAFRVASPEAIDFWAQRLTRYGLPNRRIDGTLRFEDAEGLGFELVVDESADPPLRARHPQIAEEVALRGFDGVRMYSRGPERSAAVLTDVLGAAQVDPATPIDAALGGGAGTTGVDGAASREDGAGPSAAAPRGSSGVLGRYELRSDRRGGVVTLDRAPAERPVHGAGTVHHVAFGVRDGDYEAWLPQVETHGLQTSGLVDRFYFRSIYFREPGGVLYELATDLPGFEAKNPREDWGVKTILPPWLEEHRAQIEANLQPIPNPREDWV